MANNNKIGAYIKQLREEHHLTQEDLVNLFAERSIDISVNAVSLWENGNNLPGLDHLNALGDIFGVSIDALLNGASLYDERDEEGILNDYQVDPFPLGWARARISFKKHIRKYFDGDQGPETRFLIITDAKYLFEDMDLEGDDFALFGLMRRLRKQYNDFDVFYFELQKRLTPALSIEELIPCFKELVLDGFDASTLFKALEPWEKDMYLSLLLLYTRDFSPRDNYKEFVRRYEEDRKEKYSVNDLLSDMFRILIDNGAYLNPLFIGNSPVIPVPKTNIDYFIDIHNKWEKPFEVCVKDKEGKTTFYKIENNERNRLFARHHESLVKPLREIGYNDDEIYEFASKNNVIPNEFILRYASYKGNKSTDIDELILDYYGEFETINDALEAYNKENIEASDDFDWVEHSPDSLDKEMAFHSPMVIHLGGPGCTLKENLKDIKEFRDSMALEDIEPMRNKELTKALYEDVLKGNLSNVINAFRTNFRR